MQQLRLLLKGMLAVALAGAIALPALAQGGNGAPRRFDLRLQDADMEFAMQMLSQETGLKLQFVFRPSTEEFARITLTLEDVTVDLAIKYICEAAGAVYRKDAADIYVISHIRSAPRASESVSAVPEPVREPVYVHKIVLRHRHPRPVLELLYGRIADQYGDWRALKEFQRWSVADYIGKGSGGPILMNTPSSFTNLDNLSNSALSLGNSPAAVPSPNGASNGIELPGSDQFGGTSPGGRMVDPKVAAGDAGKPLRHPVWEIREIEYNLLVRYGPNQTFAHHRDAHRAALTLIGFPSLDFALPLLVGVVLGVIDRHDDQLPLGRSLGWLPEKPRHRSHALDRSVGHVDYAALAPIGCHDTGLHFRVDRLRRSLVGPDEINRLASPSGVFLLIGLEGALAYATRFMAHENLVGHVGNARLALGDVKNVFPRDGP